MQCLPSLYELFIYINCVCTSSNFNVDHLWCWASNIRAIKDLSFYGSESGFVLHVFSNIFTWQVCLICITTPKSTVLSCYSEVSVSLFNVTQKQCHCQMTLSCDPKTVPLSDDTFLWPQNSAIVKWHFHVTKKVQIR